MLRVGAFVSLTVAALTRRSDHLGIVLGGLVVIGVSFAAWAFLDLAGERPGRLAPEWTRMVVVSVIAVAGGLVTALPASASFAAFTVIAAAGAGRELPFARACAVSAIGIVAIEVSYLLAGSSSGDVGWPFAVVAGLIVGKQWRDSRLLHAQAVALVEQAQRTREQEQRAATLDERARIAREIHDLLAHSLVALGIQVEAAQALLTDAGDVEQALPLLEQARQLSVSGLEETRGAIEALRTDTPPLPESLRSLAEGHRVQHRVPVEITVTGTPRQLSPDANLALIRTAREALTNAAKHAPSSPIAITLAYADDQTTMTVTNESARNLQPANASERVRRMSGGYGLAGMRERLLLIGGTLASGQSETGWTVTAQIPA